MLAGAYALVNHSGFFAVPSRFLQAASIRKINQGQSISTLRTTDQDALKSQGKPMRLCAGTLCISFQFHPPRHYAGTKDNSEAFGTFRQNLSPHPEDWHCACFRPVFWLAFFLRRRLPMRFSSHSGFLPASSGLQQRGAAPACLPLSSNFLGIDTGFPFHLPLEQGRGT